MPKLPDSLLDSLPNLLKSRPERQIIEQQRDVMVKIPADTSNRVLPYFITGCERCTYDFGENNKIAQIALEDCGDLKIELCPVVASIEIIKCERLFVHLSQTRGAITLDMSREVTLQLEDAQMTGEFAIYSSSCEAITICEGADLKYVLPRKDVIKSSRYKSWKTKDGWTTSKCNLYGDVLDETIESSE